MMCRPPSIYTTTLDATFLTRQSHQRSHSFAVTTTSSNNRIPDSFDSESKRRERILDEYSRLKESIGGRDPGTTTIGSSSSATKSGSMLILEEYPSREEGYNKNEKASSLSFSRSLGKEDASNWASRTTSNQECSLLDEIEKLERMYDLEHVYDGYDDNDMNLPTRPEV